MAASDEPCLMLGIGNHCVQCCVSIVHGQCDFDLPQRQWLALSSDRAVLDWKYKFTPGLLKAFAMLTARIYGARSTEFHGPLAVRSLWAVLSIWQCNHVATVVLCGHPQLPFNTHASGRRVSTMKMNGTCRLPIPGPHFTTATPACQTFESFRIGYCPIAKVCVTVLRLNGGIQFCDKNFAGESFLLLRTQGERRLARTTLHPGTTYLRSAGDESRIAAV